jgi:TetR/AcrR family transcriptional regulator, cholesterol catabolism regulator
VGILPFQPFGRLPNMASSAERGTRERIIAVAEESLGDRGYHGTRLHVIAERVGIQKASLFHYFASKADLYHAVLGEGVVESEQAVRRVLESQANPAEKLRELLENYVDMVATHPARTKILLRQSLGDAPNESTAEPERLLGLVAGFISDGQKAGVFAPMDPLALVLGVIGMVAFFFTSTTVLAPGWHDATDAERIKRHVVEMVERCLKVGDRATADRPRAVRA